MIQEIGPHALNNAYAPRPPREGDRAMIFDGAGALLSRPESGILLFPGHESVPREGYVYLFSVDDTAYYLAPAPDDLPAGFAFRALRELRPLCRDPEIFAAFTAYHLWGWYRDTRFCGRCGTALTHHGEQRAMRCPSCGLIVYPRIYPAVIVGVIRGDSLLITRYREGFRHNALVAGFTEIGETLEGTVRREVMEETGIRVKNIRYWASQPWGLAGDILTGFYCEADGDDPIRMDESELRYARWVPRREIVLQPDDLSLTNAMMKAFRDGAERIEREG